MANGEPHWHPRLLHIFFVQLFKKFACVFVLISHELSKRVTSVIMTRSLIRSDHKLNLGCQNFCCLINFKRSIFADNFCASTSYIQHCCGLCYFSRGPVHIYHQGGRRVGLRISLLSGGTEGIQSLLTEYKGENWLPTGGRRILRELQSRIEGLWKFLWHNPNIPNPFPPGDK